MSLVWFTDEQSGFPVAINPRYVVAVFKSAAGEHEGKTAINLVNGSLIVSEGDDEAFTRINDADSL